MSAISATETLAQTVRRAAVPMAIIAVKDLVVVEASPALEALLLAPLRGVSLEHSFPEAGDLLDMLHNAARGEGSVKALGLGSLGVHSGRAAHTSEVDWEWAATPVITPDGRIDHVLLNASDVSGHVETIERVEMLEGLVYLSRRVSAADAEGDLYGPLARDIGRLLGARGCVIMRLDISASREPTFRVVRPMLPAYGIDAGVLRDVSLEIEPGTAAWRVVFQGETFATDDVVHDPELAEYRSLFEGLDAKNMAAVPMRARGQTLAILLLIDKSGGFEGHDLDLAEVYAAEATLAVENARLFEQEHHVATALQEALLPGPTPDIPGLDIAAIYRPAGPAGSVGGDFYDVFPVTGDLHAFMLGDVSGKGPEAAAQTALVRHMARGLVRKERFPGPVVADLNSAVCDQTEIESFITLLFGVYDARSRVLTWANAGHPTPLYWRRGEPAHEIGLCGRALGITGDADVRIDRIKLAPGDVVVWYTDGLSESRRQGGPLLGVTPLLRSLEGIAEHDAAEIAEKLYRRAIAHGGRLQDDAAILVVKCEE